jgi:23S rRNA-/tRNA-specific pseudouridylate synthase
VVKRYRAVVAGEPASDGGTVDQPLQSAEGRANIDPGGKPSRTDWRVLRRSVHRTLVEAVPRSGRMHQIRAHLAAIGCPVVGDRLYGGPPAPRLMLHAVVLEVPWQGHALRIEAPLPPGFEAHKQLAPPETADA